MKLFYEG
jgi:hypothetical protein